MQRQEDLFNERIISTVEQFITSAKLSKLSSREIVTGIMFIISTGGEQELPSFTMGLMYEKIAEHMTDVLKSQPG
jgi:hypothetical protein